MEKIKIYIANCDFLKKEKKQIIDFLCEFGDMLEKTYKKCVEVMTCKAGEDYSEKIRQSDFCVFLCNEKNEEMIKEQFKVAHEVYENAFSSKKIFTFFKKSANETSEECKDIKDLLHLAGYCYSVFENFDEIKFHLICAIKFGFMEYIEIEDREKQGYVDGHELFDIENLSALKNNPSYNKRKEEFKNSKDELEELSAIMEERALTDEEINRYRFLKVMTRKWYKKQINVGRSQIFKASLNAMEYWIQGKASYTLCKAYQKFFAGDFDGAMEYISAEKIEKTIEDLKKKVVSNPNVFEKYIYQALAAIDIDIIKNGQSDDGMAQHLFAYMLPKAIAIPEGAEFIYRYINFMTRKGEYKKAVDAYEDFLGNHLWYGVHFKDEMKIIRAVCSAFNGLENKAAAEECFIRQLLRYKNISRFSEEYMSKYALSFFDLGEYYFGVGKSEKALEYYKAALQLNGKLYNNNPEKYIPNLAYTNYKVSIITEDKEYARRAYNLADQQRSSPTCAIVITMLAINFNDIDDDE